MLGQEIFEGEKAVAYFTKLLAVRKRLGDQSEVAFAQFYLGDAHTVTRQIEPAVVTYRKALEHYHHKAIEWKEKTQQLHQLDTIYACIGLAHKAQEDYETARQYLEKALSLAKRHDTPFIDVIEEELEKLA